MKKHLLQEFTLPLFWLFFFIVSSKTEPPKSTGIKPVVKEVKQGLSGEPGSPESKNKTAIFTKAIYLSGF